jgi:hypothetical protein
MSKDAKKTALDPMIEVAKFKDTLKDMTLEQLEELEQKIIKETDEHNDARMKMKFKMPAKNYKEAMTAIRAALDTLTVQWQYALGLKTMYEFFDPEKRTEEVDFPMLDSMLRTLGNAQLHGYDQWNYVVTISEYFDPIREDYAKASQQVYVDAEKHNMVMKEMELHTAKDDVQKAAQ